MKIASYIQKPTGSFVVNIRICLPTPAQLSSAQQVVIPSPVLLSSHLFSPFPISFLPLSLQSKVTHKQASNRPTPSLAKDCEWAWYEITSQEKMTSLAAQIIHGKESAISNVLLPNTIDPSEEKQKLEKSFSPPFHFWTRQTSQP